MTTPNIVPKFNEEGRIGRPTRRFSEVHGKFIYSDTLVLSIPEGQTIVQTTGQTAPSLNHLYFDNGRVVHGGNIIAWKSEVDDLKTVMDALLGDGSNGLSTLSSVVQSIQDLDVGEDSFVELVSKINAIEADYVTSSDINDLQSIGDLTSRVGNTEERITSAENQATLVSNTVTSQGESITALNTRANSADEATTALSGNVTALTTTVGNNQTALNESISSAVGRISTLEVTTVPTIAQEITALTTAFDTKVTADQQEFQTLGQNLSNFTTTFDAANQARIADITGITETLSVFNSDLNQGLALKVGTTQFAGLFNSNLAANEASLLNGYVTSTDLSGQLAAKVSTDQFATLLGDTFPALTNTLLSDYVTTQSLSGLLATSLTDYATTTAVNEAVTSGLTGYATTDAVTQAVTSGLAGYATTTAVNEAVTSGLTGYATTTSVSEAVTSGLAGYATTDAVTQAVTSGLTGYATTTSVSEAVTSGLSGYATTGSVTQAVTSGLAGYATTTSVSEAITSGLTGYATTDSVTQAVTSGLTGYATTTAVSEAITSGLTGYATTNSVNSALSGYTPTATLNTTLSGYTTNAALTSTLGGYVAEAEIATAVNSAMTSDNLSANGSLSNLTSFVTNVSQDTTSSAINNLSLDDINNSSSTVDWSAYSLNVAALNIFSPNTFTCADPNIELNVGQTVEYLLEVQGGVTWKRGDETYDAAFLWNEELKRFEVRQADENISRILIESDFLSLNASISAISTELASSIASLTSSISSNTELVNATETALTSKINTDVATLRTSLETSISQVQDAVSAINKSDVGLSNVENIGLSSWAGTTNISTVGTITEGTWSGAPIDSIANGIVNPNKIDSTVTDPYIFQNISVQGQLTVAGDTIQVSTTEVNIGDNIIRLNADAVGSPTEDAGFEIERGDANNVGLTWKESLQHWSLGDKSLEASGLHSSGSIEVEGSQIDLKGPVTIFDSLSVPHIDITSNMSFNTASSMVAMNTDARSPQYPAAGTDGSGASQEDISQVTTFATDNNSEQSNDSGLKVILGGADENDEFKYAFLFWDASESAWRLSESAPTTAEKNGNVARTEIVDDTSGVFDIIHSGHVGSSGVSSMGNTKLQQYSADLDGISGLTPSNNDFLVRANGGWSNLTVASVKTLLAYDTDGISEGTNQYFTQARARGSISAGGDLAYDSSTGVISYSTPTLYTSDSFATDLGATNTDSLSEGSSNQYFTQTRARGSISASGDLSYNSSTGVISFTEVGFSGKNTDNLTEGSTNLYHTTSRVRGAVSASGDLSYNSSTGVISFTEVGFSGKDTDDLTEGSTNQYFTQARARGSISVGGDLAYNSNTGVVTYSTPTLYTSDDFSTDLASADSDSLSEGSTNLYFTNTRARSAITASGSLSYNSTTGALSYTTPSSDGITEGSTNLYHTTARVRGAVSASGDLSYNSGTGVLSYSAPDSDGIDEGSTNLYHTTARARGAVSASGDLSYNSGTGIISFTERTDAEVKSLAAAQIGSSDSDDVTEGSTNLYWTNARSRGSVSASGDLSYNNQTGIFSYTQRTDNEILTLVDKPTDTDELTEGSTNLYHTTARARGAISASGDLSYNSSTGVVSFTERTDAEVTTLANTSFDTKLAASDTDDVAEGSTNLYHTATRVRDAISAGSGISINAGAISVNADQSSLISKLNVKDLFQKGSAWGRSVATSNGDTVTSIKFGYTIDGHTGPWRITRDLSFSDGALNQSVIYQLSDGIDEFKSLPDINFNLTSSTSGNDTVHSLTLA